MMSRRKRNSRPADWPNHAPSTSRLQVLLYSRAGGGTAGKVGVGMTLYLNSINSNSRASQIRIGLAFDNSRSRINRTRVPSDLARPVLRTWSGIGQSPGFRQDCDRARRSRPADYTRQACEIPPPFKNPSNGDHHLGLSRSAPPAGCHFTRPAQMCAMTPQPLPSVLAAVTPVIESQSQPRSSAVINIHIGTADQFKTLVLHNAVQATFYVMPERYLDRSQNTRNSCGNLCHE